MSTQAPPFKPFVPEHMQMRELTLRAILLGLCMTVVLGAANAYLGLRAGITIAATYPAAVISMAVLRIYRDKGSLLEENIARTSGSIGEGVAAGAIFTIPAFLISHAWASFGVRDAYWKTTVLTLVGSVLGVLFISLVRRIMVEDRELPFPESLAASEIHKAGQRGAEAAKFLFWNIGLGGLIFLLGRFGFFAADSEFALPIGRLGASRVRLGRARLHKLSQRWRSIDFRRSQHQSCLSGRWLRDRRSARRAPVFGRRDCVGPDGSASHLFPGSAAPCFPSRRRGGQFLERSGRRSLALYRSSHRGGRHAGRRGIHSLSNAHQPGLRTEARRQGPQTNGGTNCDPQPD